MTAKEVWVVKILLGTGSALFAILAAFFACIEARRDKNYSPDIKMFYVIWHKIHNSRWLRMPENIVSWLLRAKTKVAESPWKFLEWAYSPLYSFCASFLLFFGLLYLSTRFALLFATINLLLLLPALMLRLLPVNALDRIFSKSGLHDRVNDFCLSVVPILLIETAIIGAISATWLSLNIGLTYAVLLMLALLPIHWYIFLFPFLMVYGFVLGSKAGKTLGKLAFDQLPAVFMAFGIGFPLTYLSFLVGHIGKPDAPVPQTFQMLLFNVLFDGATFFTTIMILKWAISKPSFLRLPLAILVDILVAGILACCSLYFGLVFSKNALTLREVFNVLIARSPIGSEFELSPYFWSMHTSFIPTLFYLSLILLCLGGKVILQPAVWFFGVARTLRNPWKLTIAVLTLFSVLLGALSYGAGAIEDHLKEKEKGKKIETSYYLRWQKMVTVPNEHNEQIP